MKQESAKEKKPMTSDELKIQIPMRSVLEMYGYTPNHSGFICCPFHHERTASCKIYKDSYYCFGCGAHGDIFDFVQQMEQCDFKTAFKRLGGTYGKMTDSAAYKIAKRKAEVRTREARKARLRKRYGELADRIRELSNKIRNLPDPFTDGGSALIEKQSKYQIELDEIQRELFRDD